MTIEITPQAQVTLNWLRDPITKGFIEFLKAREQYFIENTQYIVENAIISGSLERTKDEIGAFNLLRNYREILQDIYPCFEIAHQENEFTLDDIITLQDLFKTLTKIK